MEAFPQVLKNVRTSQKIDLDAVPNFQKRAQQIEEELGKDGRLLVRLSGTEPVVRVMLEGKNLDGITTMADELCELIRKYK